MPPLPAGRLYGRSYGLWTTVVCALVAAAVVLGLGGATGADGPLLDVLVLSRAYIYPARDAVESPVAVVALDQRSLSEPELRAYPRAFLAPVWAGTLDALFDAGARTVGFDLLLSYSANQFFPDFDRPLLEALSRYRDRVVLARSASTLPAPPILAALRFDERVLGLGEVRADWDGTYRRVRAVLETEQNETLPSLANALLRRANFSAMPDEVIIAPRQHPETLPTFALIDVLRCAKDAPEVLGRVFRGKIVLVGGTLPEEDRRPFSGRYLSPPQTNSSLLHSCGLRQLGASVPNATTIPGVFLHAAAIEAVLTDRVVSVVPLWILASLAAGAAAAGAALGSWRSPWETGASLVGIVGIFLGAGTVVLEWDHWLPLAIPILAVMISAAVAYVVRYLVIDRVRIRIQKAFNRYLAPSLVEKLAQDPGALTLGGERRKVTVMFADLSGFTRLSTRVPPEVLVNITNRYLGFMVEAVDASGGYVNQILGDAVMALWGAPATDTLHALHGVQAAQDIVRRVMVEKAMAEASGTHGFDVKIGLESGWSVIGNMGAENRYNYTATGETVNLAARLESIPPLYGCRIVLGPKAAELVREAFLLRELDHIIVKGKDQPITVYEPMILRTQATPRHTEVADRYAEGLLQYRAGRFAEAAVLWEKLASIELELTREERPVSECNPSSKMAGRARALLADPPTEPWTGVWVLSFK